MLVKQQWEVTCRGCKKKITVYEYEGLEGGRYTSHHCEEMLDYLKKHPRAQRLFDPKV